MNTLEDSDPWFQDEPKRECCRCWQFWPIADSYKYDGKNYCGPCTDVLAEQETEQESKGE